MAIYKRSVTVESEIDKGSNLITKESKTYKVWLFGIPISLTTLKRDVEKYKGESFGKDAPLGFAKNS